MEQMTPKQIISEKIISPVKEFIEDSRSVGITLIICTIISLLISNSGWSEGYINFWNTEINITAPRVHMPHTVLHVINDGLMTVFFFLVGLEIKRELMVGELASVKKAMLPIFAAVGGMAVPAFIYWLWCGGTPFSKGWGIPMATDIAFSLGVLSLLGKRAPLSLRIFLTALAIIDDLGGILTIAIFYAKEINWAYIFISAGILFFLAMMNFFKIKRYHVYIMMGFFLWYTVFNSGVHATIAGVLLAFTVPLHKIGKVIGALHDPVSFIVLPLFALANTAIVLPNSYHDIFSSPLNYGIFMGLVLGKPLGIFIFSFIAVKTGIGSLPVSVKWKQVLGVGMIAGVGFTISIFMSTLAFDLPDRQLIAKVSIMSASLAAAICGFFYLKLLNKKVNKKLAV